MHFTSRILCTLIVVSAILNTEIVLAQSSVEIESLQTEIQAIRQGQQQIQKDLAEIKKLLQQGNRPTAPKAQAFKPTDLTIGASAVLGNNDAQVTMVGFSDYQCPYCSRHATTVLPELIKEYVDTGKLKIVMREFPIVKLHPRAMNASHAALCAAEQDKYWEMHDLIFSTPKQIEVENLKSHARTLGLDSDQFNSCLDKKKYTAQIRANQIEGQKYGISGTPSFVLGLTNPRDPDKVRLTKFVRGARSLSSFKQVIDELLGTQ